MNKFFIALTALCCVFMSSMAQIVTTSPSPLKMSSKGIVLTYDAASALGNKGLNGLASSVKVYAHIGLITNKSTSGSDWKYVVTSWPSSATDASANTDKNLMTYVEANKYTLSISDIRSYFGMTDPNEYATQIALVFRNADGSKTGKTKSGGDIYVDVVNDGFAIDLSCDHSDRVIDKPTTMTFTLTSTEPSDLSLSVNNSVVASQKNATELVAQYTFSENGTYNVEAKSVYDGNSYIKSLEIRYPNRAKQQDYPGGVPQMGAVKNADGTVTFCLAAPDKFSVQLVGSWNDYEIDSKYFAYYQDYNGQRYFWTTVEGLADDVYYPYFFIVDDVYKVADPYAHLVLDCYSDKTLRTSVWRDVPKYPYDKFSNVMMGCYRGDIDDYTFSDFTIPDHENLVIYELLLRDFTGYDDKAYGWGTVAKAIEKIEYIKEMGFNAIELMPIMEFNGNNSWGYNTNFYMAPDKAYGSPKDYKDFIEACHKAGIAVILDIVFNQSDGLHPWYQMYPIANNPFYNKTAPHAWSVLNDWNQDHPLVQQQWTDALKYWMEKYNVDGFRFDLVKGLGDNGSYSAGTDSYNQSRIDRMCRLHDVIKSVKPNGIHINENLAGAQEETAMGNDGQLCWANINDASCQFAMGWDDGNNNIMRFLSSKDSRPWGSTVAYAESHDEQRMGYKCVAYGNGNVKTDAQLRNARLGALAVQMLMTPGPKMVWMFGELGDEQNAKNDNGDNNTDAKIVNWKWLEDADKLYLKDTYASVINFRMNNPELFANDATFETQSLMSKFTKGRTMRLAHGDKEVIAFINPSMTETMTISTTATSVSATNNNLIRASYGIAPVLNGEGTISVELAPNSFAIFANNASSGVETLPAIDSNKAYAVGAQGRIDIIGEYSNVEVYDLAGRRASSLYVAPGIYVVNIDGVVSKIVVR